MQHTVIQSIIPKLFKKIFIICGHRLELFKSPFVLSVGAFCFCFGHYFVFLSLIVDLQPDKKIKIIYYYSPFIFSTTRFHSSSLILFSKLFRGVFAEFFVRFLGRGFQSGCVWRTRPVWRLTPLCRCAAWPPSSSAMRRSRPAGLLRGLDSIPSRWMNITTSASCSMAPDSRRWLSRGLCPSLPGSAWRFLGQAKDGNFSSRERIFKRRAIFGYLFLAGIAGSSGWMSCR